LNPRTIQIPVFVFAMCLASAMAVHGQDDSQPPERQHVAAAGNSAWTWATDANVIVGFNYQQRKFADFSAWESQNSSTTARRSRITCFFGGVPQRPHRLTFTDPLASKARAP